MIELPHVVVDRIREELAARATVAAYREHGPIPPACLEAAARELRWHAGDLFARGFDLLAIAAVVLADRCDDTAELGRLFAARTAAA